jgi:CRISPR-associated protein Cmr2
MQRLRHAYSGQDPDHAGGVHAGLTLHQGFALLGSRLMRMMGAYATASCGAVIAHHQAPLGAVMRELRAAEARAKDAGGRDAFSLTVIKRSGGSLKLTEKWDQPVKLLQDMRALLADAGVSRRAVYNSLEWLKDLPEPADGGEMLKSLLCYQLTRQADTDAQRRHPIPELAERLTVLAIAKPRDRLQALQRFLSVAEFLARESRGGEAR